jgi:2-keto-4-pentenoate hydratase/2-oxohepta-3-ene-1,7-dioic acid hydratase in catechol pathway
MKLVTYVYITPIGQIRRVGAMSKNGRVIDLENACLTNYVNQYTFEEAQQKAKWLMGSDMVTFLERGDEAMQAAKKSIEFIDSNNIALSVNNEKLAFDLNEVKLLSPLPRPVSIRDFSCIEEHYLAAIKKLGTGTKVPQSWYDWPPYYKGNPLTVIGHKEDVVWPSYATEVDYELEVAMVIGKKGKNIKREDATEYIAGFTLFNDISIRNIQPGEQSTGVGLSKSKDFDTGNVLGPWIVTRDEFEGREAKASISVNGEVRGVANLNAMYHSWERLIEHSSQSETLYPGEVFGSGSLGKGSGIEFGRYLKPDDVVVLEVEGIGKLENRLIKIH